MADLAADGLAAISLTAKPNYTNRFGSELKALERICARSENFDEEKAFIQAGSDALGHFGVNYLGFIYPYGTLLY